MDPHKLGIEIALENDAALAAARQFRDAQRQALRQTAADAEATEKAITAALKQEGQARLRDEKGRFVATRKEAEDTAKEVAESFKRTGDSASAGFTKMGIASAIAQVGFSKLLDVVHQVGAAVDRAAAASAVLANRFITQREDLGELANLQGRQADKAFTLEFAKFGKQTGMTPEENKAFQLSFYNSGAQFIGAGPGQMPEAQANQFKLKLAQLAVARQIDPKVVADLGAKQLGVKDYSKLGAAGPGAALADVNQTIAVLAAGGGEASQLGRETVKLQAAAQNEDALKGVFQSSKDTATFISTLTEGFPEGQAEAAAAALRAIRGFEKAKGGKFLKRAGVRREDDPFEAVRKLQGQAEKEAASRIAAGEKGLTVQDIFRENIDEELAARSLAVLGNVGIGRGVFAARRRTAAENATPEAAQAQIRGFTESGRGQARLAAADVEASRVERGAELEKVDTLRKQALAELIRTKQVDTVGTNLTDFVGGTVAFGALGSGEQRRINLMVQQMLNQRTPESAAGAKFGSGLSALLDPARAGQGWDEALTGQIEAIEAAGGNPFGDVVQRGGKLEREARLPGLGAPPPPEVPPMVDPDDPLRMTAVNRARREAGLPEVGGGGGMTEKTGQEMVGELKKLNNKVGPRGPEPAPRVALGAPAAPRR